jgi:hypothetical protein
MSAVAMKTFFTQMLQVVDNLVEMFPDDADFPTFKTLLVTLQKTNPTLVVKTFRENVTDKYEAQIVARDEGFLLSYQGAEYGADVEDLVSKVKSYWNVLDDQTKDSLWQYLYILNELCKRAYTPA